MTIVFANKKDRQPLSSKARELLTRHDAAIQSVLSEARALTAWHRKTLDAITNPELRRHVAKG